MLRSAPMAKGHAASSTTLAGSTSGQSALRLDAEPGAPPGAPRAEPPVGALARLKQHLPHLKGTSQRIGTFVVENPWEARGLSINDLAERVTVSVNSVVRLTRELGFKGYREFSQALTLVRRTVDALCAANAMLFVGTGSGIPVCSLAAYRLTLLGLRATYSGDPNTILAELHLLSPGDEMFAEAYHGATPHLVRALRHARRRGITTVCVPRCVLPPRQVRRRHAPPTSHW
jgi:DNA-binding MurR/RpiR family transcriptional regulator